MTPRLLAAKGAVAMTQHDEHNPNPQPDLDPAPDSLELAIASFRGSPPGT